MDNSDESSSGGGRGPAYAGGAESIEPKAFYTAEALLRSYMETSPTVEQMLQRRKGKRGASDKRALEHAYDCGRKWPKSNASVDMAIIPGK